MIVPVLARGGNDAVDINPPNAVEHIVTDTSDWLWTAFSIILLSTLVMAFLTFMVSRSWNTSHG